MYKWIWNGKYFHAEHNETIRADKDGNVFGGGGSEPQIQQAPTTPAPSPAETSEQALQAQLKYNPQLYQQYAQMYGQYAPQVAGTDMGIQQQYAPQKQALQQQMYPQQTQLVEAMARQALGQMSSQDFQTPEQAQAVEAIRGRETSRLQQSMRERANLGGNLYGGRAAGAEERAVSQMGQGFAAQDVDRLRQQQQMALAYAAPIAQMLYPQVTSPSMPNFTQPVVPSADALYNAAYGASQPQYYTSGGSQGQGGALGSMGGMALGAALAAPTGGMSIPMGAMLGGAGGGAFGSMF